MNAACQQYSINCPSSLPFTGFDLVVIIAVAIGLLAGGGYLAYVSWRRRK